MTDRLREADEQLLTAGSFVGRETEQERWRGMLRDIISNKRGLVGTLLGTASKQPAISQKIKSRVILINGTAGIGKTRFSLRLREIAQREKAFVRRFRPTRLDIIEAAERDRRLAVISTQIVPPPELMLDIFYNHFVRDDFELAFEDYRAAINETRQLAASVQDDELKAVWEFRARAMGSGLARAAQEEKPLLFIIENYQRIAPLSWLVRPMMEESGSGVTWLLVGADKGTEWEADLAPERFVNFQLAPLNETELSQFMQSELGRYADNVIEDEEGVLIDVPKPEYRSAARITALHEASAGLPLAIRMQAYLLQVGLTVEEIAATNTPLESLLQQILDESLGGTHPDRLKIYALALLRRPESGLLSAMLSLRADYLPVNELLGQLRTRYTFLFEPGQNMALHPALAPTLQGWLFDPLRRTDETGVAKLTRRAFDYLDERLREWGQTFNNLRNRVADLKWSDWAIDTAWFHFWENEEDGWREATPLLIAGAAYKPIVAQQMLATLERLAALSFLQPTGLARLENLRGLPENSQVAWTELQKLGQHFNWFDARWPQYADEFEIVTQEQLASSV